MSSLPSLFEPAVASAPSADDRRTSARTRLFTLVHSRGQREPLWAWDIGLGGMQCRSRAARWPGTYLDLRFTLPGTDDTLDVGGQVLTLDQLEDDGVSLGMRFCMLSPRAQRSIYRFIDARRVLWAGEAPAVTPQPKGLLDTWLARSERPFEAMLLEAHASLRARELRQLAFVRSIAHGNLPRLSDLCVARAA
jgi:hypothetical protein